MRRARLGLALALALALVLGGAVAASFLAHRGDAPAPDFQVVTLDGETFRLSHARGRVVVIDFFATWCASCKITERELRQAHAEWPDTVMLLSIDVDPFETEADARRYRDEAQIPWPVALDRDNISVRYGVFELGRVIVVDVDGRPVMDRVGIVDAATISTAVAAASRGEAESVRLARPGLLALGVAAGAASFFSPCCAPMLPAYLSMGLPRPEESRRALLARRSRDGLLAAGGLLLVYAALGGLMLLAGSLVRGIIPHFQAAAGVALVGVGLLALARPSLFDGAASRLSGLTRARDSANGAPWRASLLLGVAFAGASAGCTLPVLLQLGVAAALVGPVLGGATLAMYALTAASLLVGFAILPTFLPERAMRGVRQLAAWGRTLPRLMGAVFMATGAALLYVYLRASGVVPL